jgi:hypothetical protein
MFTFSSHATTDLVIGDFIIRRGQVVQRNDLYVAEMDPKQASNINLAVSEGLLSITYAADPTALTTGPLPNWPFTQTL